MTVALVMDAVLCLLLGAALFGGWRLHGKLKALRSGEAELKVLISQLNAAAERAQASVVQLRAAAHETDDVMGERLRRGRALADELQIMNESGEYLANRLERVAGAAASAATQAAPRPVSLASVTDPARLRKAPPVDRPVQVQAAPAPVSDEETAALLRVLKGVR
jgi:hypothetical protein